MMNNIRIKSEAYAHALQQTATPAGQYSDAERHALLKTVLESVAEQEPLWVFAYGSLLWRPGFRPVEVQIATVHGWRRSLDIDAVANRGSVISPGLWFGLAPGGSVTGVAMRIPTRWRVQVLETMLRREIPDDAYRLGWAIGQLPGGKKVRALTFFTNRDSSLYAGNLQTELVAERMALASGAVGRARCYLLRTQATLKNFGLRDRHIDFVAHRLHARFGPCVEKACVAAGQQAV